VKLHVVDQKARQAIQLRYNSLIEDQTERLKQVVKPIPVEAEVIENGGG
jgi:hypothetical protein